MTVGVADEHSDGGAGNFTRRVMQNWAHRLHRFGSPSHAAAVLEHVPIDMRTTAEADFLRVLEIVRFGALARASADAVAAASAIEPGSAADLKAVADAKAAGAPAEGTRRIVLTAVQLNRTFYVQQYTVVTPEPGTHLTRRDTTLWTDTENHDMPIRDRPCVSSRAVCGVRCALSRVPGGRTSLFSIDLGSQPIYIQPPLVTLGLTASPMRSHQPHLRQRAFEQGVCLRPR